MHYHYKHQILFDDLVANGNDTGNKGKYIMLTKGDSQKDKGLYRENAKSAISLILYQ